jgi:acetyltransferase-like isoleucine patch superfamily enzyme/acyl carrier protein
MKDPAAATSRNRPGSFIDGLRAALHLGSIKQVGKGTVLSDRPHVENDGAIQIGKDCYLGSHPIRSHLVVMRDARLTLGDRVFISYGAAISAKCAIHIGDDTRIGPLCLILDNDFHSVGDREGPGGVAAIEIGRNVTLGARVTVLRGARIGDGAHVASGSTVAGLIPNGAVVSGVPARVGGSDPVRNIGRSVATIVARVFALKSLPHELDGPCRIAAWDDAGAIRLLLALEEAFALSLSEQQFAAAQSVAEVTQLVALARKGSPHRPAVR